MEEKKVKLVAAVCTQCGAQLEVDPNSGIFAIVVIILWVILRNFM